MKKIFFLLALPLAVWFAGCTEAPHLDVRNNSRIPVVVLIEGGGDGSGFRHLPSGSGTGLYWDEKSATVTAIPSAEWIAQVQAARNDLQRILENSRQSSMADTKLTDADWEALARGLRKNSDTFDAVSKRHAGSNTCTMEWDPSNGCMSTYTGKRYVKIQDKGDGQIVVSCAVVE